MGFFSWKTADKDQSIANCYSAKFKSKTVYLLQPHDAPIPESNYEGYGVFGGIDAYAWLAKTNAQYWQHQGCFEDIARLDIYEDTQELREFGIKLAFDMKDKIIFPLKFSYNKDANYHDLKASAGCEYQGFFYDIELND